MTNIDLNTIKRIHFTGIKGVGMTSLACVAKDYGLEVSGSDTPESFHTDQALTQKHIQIKTTFSEQNITNLKPDLVVYSAAHQGEANPEVRRALEQGIPAVTFGEILGAFQSTKEGISVAGVGGKTTVTAMLATVFEKAQVHPSYMIGVGEIPSLALPGKYDHEGEVFIAEADEYACSPTNQRPKFFYQNPKAIVITNLAYDHPDVYKSPQETLDTFAEFIRGIPEDGLLVACGDSEMVQELLQSTKLDCMVLTYGSSEDNNYQLKNYQVHNQEATWEIHHAGKVREFTLKIPGEFNAKNATATALTADFFGLNYHQIQQGLSAFTGTKRRFEFVRRDGTNLYYDDYAHHPQEIEATIKAAREWFGDKKIWVIFQPHTFSRTKALLEEFAQSLSLADQVFVADIFPSAREPYDESINSEMLAGRVRELNENVEYLPKDANFSRAITEKSPENTVIFTMGAGDIYRLVI